MLITLDVIVIPLLFGRNRNLCPKYASETVFSGPKCKIFPALRGGTPPPRPSPRSVASLPRSAPRSSAHSDFRPPPPPPPKNFWLRACDVMNENIFVTLCVKSCDVMSENFFVTLCVKSCDVMSEKSCDIMRWL